MQDSQLEYKSRQEDYQDKLGRLKKKMNIISNIRLLTIVLGLGFTIYLYFSKGSMPAGILLLVTLVLFIPLVIFHSRLKSEAGMVQTLLNINIDSLKRKSDEWKDFDDNGGEFEDYDHPYTSDLDIFGKSSLFQWINTAVTYKGRNIFKGWLDAPSKDISVIKKRQSAAMELSSLIDWRQRFQAEALQEKDGYSDPKPLCDWVEKPPSFYTKAIVSYTARFLPLITLAIFIASYILKFTYLLPVTLLIIQMILIGVRYVDMNDILSEIEPFTKNIKVYRKMLELFETQKFESAYLNELQSKLKNERGNYAYTQISQLEKVTNKVEVRHSQLYLIINILFLWDYRCLAEFEQWKKNSGLYLSDWINIIGELEALSSLAVLYCDHSDWVVPQLYDGKPKVFANQIGHPLLHEYRVCNDIGIMREGQVYLITGSNMSGKSTLLRTVGINLVLAYAGAPVCAKEFHASIFSLYTSMRIRDDLSSNISTFYAELLRIKKMIDAAKGGEPVFFLLDEIFRGTNSRDRHTGARVLIKQLSGEGAVGFVSTHDVELGDLADESSKIKNYHFSEEYIEGQLQFDYKLRAGISNTRNAVYLMKMAGLTVPGE